MSTLHQVHLFTSTPSKTWASCATCGRKSKQGTKANAEAWMARHRDETTARYQTAADERRKAKKQ